MLGNRYVIFIGGKAGAGKSTIADELNDVLNTKYKSVVLPVASSLKRICSFLGWDGEKDERGRKLLIDCGKVFREYDKDVWIKKSLNTLFSCGKDFDFIIIDDWRYPNEVDFVTEAHVGVPITFIINRPYSDTLLDSPLGLTDSETSLDKYRPHGLINNNGTISKEHIVEDMYVYIQTMIKEW